MAMKRTSVGLLVSALLLAACGGGGDGGAPMAAACPSTQTQDMPPAPAPGAPPAGITLALEQIDHAGLVFAFPLFLTAPPGDTNRLFVVERAGVIKVVDRTDNSPIGTFLDITNLVVSTAGERGLLGLAFDPQYATNRRFYVSYTDENGGSVVARYLADPDDADVALPTADRILLTQFQPFDNHNGGMIAFGADGFLYIGFGDGGSGGDPGNRAQNLGELLGKLLRIDVSSAAQAPDPAYDIPPGNPCVGQAGARAEIWSMGLRNPWRYSFDRQSGDLYLADVGQNAREEVNVSTSAAGAGLGSNYGWNIMEGTLCFPIGSTCSTTGMTLPAVEYDHTEGCSITGGYVYRGEAIPALQGTYFYGDFCADFVRSFRFVDGMVTEHAEWPALAPGDSSPASARMRRASSMS